MGYEDSEFYTASEYRKWSKKNRRESGGMGNRCSLDPSLMRSISQKNASSSSTTTTSTSSSSKSPQFLRSYSQRNPPSSKATSSSNLLSRSSSTRTSCPSSPSRGGGGGGGGKSTLMRSLSKKGSAFGKKCTHLAKEQKARFYIMKRCVSMLVSWRKNGDS